MRRFSIGRLIAIVFVATIVSLLSIDTTQACRFLWRHRLAVCPPVVTVPAGFGCGMADCSPCPLPVDCCGDEVVGDVLIEAPIVDGCGMTTSCAPIVEPYPSAPVEAAPTKEPTPAVQEPTPAAQTPAEVEKPAAAEPPAGTDATTTGGGAAAEPTLLPDVDETPDTVLPADNAMETEAVPAAGDGGDGGLLEEQPSTEAPATDNALPGGSGDSLDDIFAEPSATGAPATAPATGTPAKAAPATGAPAPGTPTVPPSAPPTKPADKGTDSLDDLFGDSSTDSATSTEPRMANTPEKPKADDLFDDAKATAPADQPAVEKAQDAADDLFPADEPAPAKGTEAAPKQGADKDTLDDLFGSNPAGTDTRSKVSSTTQLAETQGDRLPFRVWTDNTGNYQTVGRLVQVSTTHIRLLKDNSRFSTVAKSRLSQADLAYIDQMVKQLGLEIVDQLAQR